MKRKRKEAGKKVLSVVLAAATVMSIMPAYVAKAAGTVATVMKNGTTTSYDSISKAWDAVKDGGTIDLKQNWDTSSQGRLKVSEKAIVTINLNGYIINRGRASDNSSSSKKDGETI